MCSGLNYWHTKTVERLGVPSICVSDGPHGLRKHLPGGEEAGLPGSVPATCFPTASATACSWDIGLMHEIGEALAEESLQEDVSVLLGPGVNIKRSPLCGRNFEYISEDPYLSGEMAAALIRGVQSRGVGTSLKHFAVNSQETRRLTIDAVVDERALREIYLAGFEKAVKQGQPLTVMCAYNRLNGTYCSEHKRLLTDILRNEWGFGGPVMSDWGAVNDRAAGVAAGLDLEMPGNGGINDKRIVAAVKDGTLDEAILDETVARMLALASGAPKTGGTYDTEAHHALARRAAAHSAVLLKNEGGVLPLSKESRIAVIGGFAKSPRYQGNGSSLVHPVKIESAYDAFAARDVDIAYRAGYDSSDRPGPALIEEAVQAAKESGAAVVFAGLPDTYESEGFDRLHMDMPQSHNDLISAVAKANPNTVVVLQNGAPVAMPWIHDVKAVLECYLGGQAGGPAAVDILLGDVNPSGKLAETFPLRLSDTPCYRYYPGGPDTVTYRESVYVGYRYYDTAKKKVLFPFGHGLSYTRFTYTDMALSAERIDDRQTLDVTVTVKNTGGVAGAEIIELYVKDDRSTIFRPEKELKGFEKVYLEPGEQKAVTFTLGKRSFAYYNVHTGGWHVPSGAFTVMAGSSSGRIHLTGTVYVESTQPDVQAPDYSETAPGYYRLGEGELEMGDGDFRAVLGRELPPKKISPFPYHPNSTLGDTRKRLIGRIVYKIIMRIAKKDYASMQMIEETIAELPLRGLVTFSDGMFTFGMMKALILMLNHKWIRGAARLLHKDQ